MSNNNIHQAEYNLEVIRFLSTNGGSFHKADISNNTGIDINAVSETLSLLKSIDVICEEGRTYSLNLSDNSHKGKVIYIVALNILKKERGLQPRKLYREINDVLGGRYRERRVLDYLNRIARNERTIIRKKRVGPTRRSKDYFYLIQYEPDLGEIYNRDSFTKKEKPSDEVIEKELPEEPFSDVTEFIEYLKKSKSFSKQIVYVKDIPPKDAIYAEPKTSLNPQIKEYLEEKGLYPLFSHQAKAIDLINAGENILVTTPNASGKTLCYLIPIFEKALENQDSTFIYICPTKALAQDQLTRFAEFDKALNTYTYPTPYDGDIHTEFRETIRTRSHLILTNPDELHYAILPYHYNWGIFFENLKYIIIDEIHTYQGVFGSHVSNIFWRLNRICNFYGSKPQYIGISATISNPNKFATKLTGKKFELIRENGAPSPSKYFVLWNPIKNESDQLDRNIPFRDSKILFKEHVKHDLSTLMFTLSRKTTEIQVRGIKEELIEELSARIASYRAGYTPMERRAIERRLLNNELLGVVSTNALELGIDIGSLDATILLGYPGTVASTWQQANRAGRRGRKGLITFIALNDPLNQYLVKNPDYFFERTPEEAIIDPYNEYIFLDHLMCAATELQQQPLKIDEINDESEDLKEVLNLIPTVDSPDPDLDKCPNCQSILQTIDGIKICFSCVKTPVFQVNGRILSNYRRPHQAMSIRGSASHLNQIEIFSDSKKIGSCDYERALEELYEGSIYLHQGESYYTEKLDLESMKANVKKVDVDYYTVPFKNVSIRILKKQKEEKIKDSISKFGELLIEERVVAFYKIDYNTGKKIDKVELNQPKIQLKTKGFWLEFDSMIPDKLSMNIKNAYAGIHAIEHLLSSLMPLHILCDPRDIKGVTLPGDKQIKLFIFDKYKGGIGLCERGFDHLEALLNESLKAVKSCRCKDGCPSCIQIANCSQMNENLSKEYAIKILEYLLSQKPSANSNKIYNYPKKVKKRNRILLSTVNSVCCDKHRKKQKCL